MIFSLSDSLCCGILPFVLFVLTIVIPLFVRIVMQYEKGIVFTLGKFQRIADPGLHFIIPFLQEMRKIDTRILSIDIPKQEVMTKDNVPVMVNGVVFFRVEDVEKAILKIQDYKNSVSMYAQTALRDVIGNKELDVILSNREEVANEIKMLVDKETTEWGVDITGIKVQDIELPADMKRAMARQAEAERERRATIIISSGEKAAAQNLADAATTLSQVPGALHLRTLQTLADVSADQSNTIVFLIPIEVLEAMKGFINTQKSSKGFDGYSDNTPASSHESF
ncbi:MAG: slipin family protein [Candidatus Micrarchaeia archaeon]